MVRKFINPVTGKDLLFLVTLIAVQLIVLYGKVLAMVVTSQVEIGVFFKSITDTNLTTYSAIIIGALFYFFLKISKTTPQFKVFAGAMVGLIAMIVIGYVRHSTVITILLLFCYVVATLIIFIDHYFEKNLDNEFWELVFGASMKGLQLVIALFGIGMIVLRLFVEKKVEVKAGFLSTFLSATVSIVAILFMLANWVFLPCWLKLVEGHTKEPERTRTPIVRARELRRKRGR